VMSALANAHLRAESANPEHRAVMMAYVPQELALSRGAPDYRFLAVRERVAQGGCPG